MERSIWFGTKDYARWLPAPSVNNYASGAANWTTKTSYLNGGAYVRNSFGSHREYNLAWNLKSQAELNPVLDFAQGLYGDGLIYWVDPFAQYTNVLPKDWSAPMLGGYDGISLTGDVRPTLTPTSANSFGFPTQSAVFTSVGVGGAATYVPIPPNHDLIVRAYGSGTANMTVKQTNQSPVIVPWTTVDDMNNAGNLRRFSADALGSGVEVYLGAGASATVTAVMAQIVKAGETPHWDGFLSGQGNTGCRFEGMPQSSPYSAAMDKIGMSAKLVEVGAWL